MNVDMETLNTYVFDSRDAGVVAGLALAELGARCDFLTRRVRDEGQFQRNMEETRLDERVFEAGQRQSQATVRRCQWALDVYGRARRGRRPKK